MLLICWIAYCFSPSASVFYIYFKTLVVSFDIVLAALLYQLTYKSVKRFLTALIAAGYVLVDPTIWFTSAVLGQLDVVYVVFLVASLWFLIKEKLGWSASMLGLAALLKQPAAPFILAIPAYIAHRNGGQAALNYFIKAFGVFLLVSLPFFLTSPKDFVAMYIYLGPTLSPTIKSTVAYGLWAAVSIIQQTTSIDLGWLVAMRFPMFYLMLVLPAIYLYRRDSSIGTAYILPALAFISFSPQVLWHYLPLLVPFTIYAVITEHYHPFWLTAIVVPSWHRYIPYINVPPVSLYVKVFHAIILLSFLALIYGFTMIKEALHRKQRHITSPRTLPKQQLKNNASEQ
jgi:Gpi18-like mannosyltransferase